MTPLRVQDTTVFTEFNVGVRAAHFHHWEDCE